MSDNVAPQFHEFLHDRIILDRTNVLIELHGIGERYEQLRVVLDRFQPGSKAERIIVADVDPVQPMQGDLKVGLKGEIPEGIALVELAPELIESKRQRKPSVPRMNLVMK